MPKKNLDRSDWFPYHVTARTNNRVAFPAPMDEMWRLFENECFMSYLKFNVEIHSFVLMPNHFHMLITIPQYDLGIVMQDFMRNISKKTNALTARTGHVFGGPYYWSLIKKASYFYHAFRYVYQNPLRAGICSDVENYRYSTLQGLMGNTHLAFPVMHTRSGLDQTLPHPEPIHCLSWLNKTVDDHSLKWIRSALKKRIFEPPKDLQNKPIFIAMD